LGAGAVAEARGGEAAGRQAEHAAGLEHDPALEGALVPAVDVEPGCLGPERDAAGRHVEGEAVTEVLAKRVDEGVAARVVDAPHLAGVAAELVVLDQLGDGDL